MDRKWEVGLPGYEERLQMFYNFYPGAKATLAATVAHETKGYTPAELQSLFMLSPMDGERVLEGRSIVEGQNMETPDET